MTAWYLLGGVNPANCIAAYQPVGAASLAASYVNIAHPGINNAAPGVAPVFDTAVGWVFDGATTYLDTGIVPENDQTWSVIARVSGEPDNSLVDAYDSGTGVEIGLWISAHLRACNGGDLNTSAVIVSGQVAFAGALAYFNGVQLAGAIPAIAGAFALSFFIGATNEDGAAVDFTIGNIQAVAIYDCILTPGQVALISAKMGQLPLPVLTPIPLASVCSGYQVGEYFYYVDVADPFGNRLAQIESFLSLTYSRIVNGVTEMIVDLPPDADRSLFRLDGRLGIWRQPADRRIGLETDTVWLIRKFPHLRLLPSGERRLTVYAVNALEMLIRRIVAYAAGSAEADKVGIAADDMIKDIIFQNLGAGAGARGWWPLVTTAPYESLGAVVSKAFSRRNVLTVCQEIADQTYIQTPRVYFDMICPTYGDLEFRTWINQRGADRTRASGNPLILSPELGNVSEADYYEDYETEENFIYAGGQGEEALREIATAQDNARIGASPFGRREGFCDSRQGATGASLTAEAETRLNEMKPRRHFTCKLTDTEQVRYGRDWQWGDRLPVQFWDMEFECEIRQLDVQVAGGVETIGAILASDEAI